MKTEKIVTVLGGDLRQLYVAERFLTAVNRVNVCGLPQEKIPSGAAWVADWREAVTDADTVILPLPSVHDGTRVATPLMPDMTAIRLSELFEEMRKGSCLAAGRLPAEARADAEAQGLSVFDYFESEALQVKNALPTAEGAVWIAMKESDRTVKELPVVVTGFGRIARALTALLLSMGARVTVAARKTRDLQEARGLGCGTLSLLNEADVAKMGRGYAIIFNTVPACILTEPFLCQCQKETLIIDLASLPGGVDAEAAARQGIRVIWALSLPGKYAPRTAGEFIAETILDHMREEGMI